MELGSSVAVSSVDTCGHRLNLVGLLAEFGVETHSSCGLILVKLVRVHREGRLRLSLANHSVIVSIHICTVLPGVALFAWLVFTIRGMGWP